MNAGKLQALFKEAVAHHRANRLERAEALYRQARGLAPKHFDVLHHSGLVAYQLGKTTEAIDWLTRAHALDPKSVVCEMRLGLALMSAGRLMEAENHLRNVVAKQPDFSSGWDNLAACLKSQDRLADAVACHEKSIALNPKQASAWFNYGLTQSLRGRVEEALECHEKALAADPSYAMALFGKAQALQQSHRPAEAVEFYARFLAVRPDAHDARSFRLFCLHYLEDVSREQIFAEHIAYGQSLGQTPGVAFSCSRDPLRRLRVAILSPDLREHSCAYFIEPLLRHLSRAEFEIYLYHDHIREDATSARLRELAAVWRNFVGQPARQVEQIIRSDAPDILIDLAGHTGMTPRLPLFARRLAPVQITYLGYPDTSGAPGMDYRFTDDYADPAGEADRFATERLVRFSSCAWTYAPPANAPAAGARERKAGEPFAFGSFNNLAKVTDRQLAIWAEILGQSPGTILKLKGKGLSKGTVRASFQERAARAGLLLDRVELIERAPDTASHLAMYDDVDVALDTFPYHGTTTTCEALWMGVPVITRRGDRHMSRVGASLLTTVGHPEWIAESQDDYVRIAVSLAEAGQRSAQARERLRAQVGASLLLDARGQAARFAGALRECWAQWCREKNAAAAA